MEEELKKERKKVILSGIQPTGVFTLGNYIGAVRHWGLMQEEYQCAYFVADLHSLTVRQEPAELRRRTLEAFALLLACGVDLKKVLYLCRAMSAIMQNYRGFFHAIPRLAHSRE